MHDRFISSFPSSSTSTTSSSSLSSAAFHFNVYFELYFKKSEQDDFCWIIETFWKHPIPSSHHLILYSCRNHNIAKDTRIVDLLYKNRVNIKLKILCNKKILIFLIILPCWVPLVDISFKSTSFSFESIRDESHGYFNVRNKEKKNSMKKWKIIQISWEFSRNDFWLLSWDGRWIMFFFLFFFSSHNTLIFYFGIMWLRLYSSSRVSFVWGKPSDRIKKFNNQIDWEKKKKL